VAFFVTIKSTMEPKKTYFNTSGKSYQKTTLILKEEHVGWNTGVLYSLIFS